MIFIIMRLKSNLTLRRVGRNYMVVQLCDEGANLTNVYTMNETAAWLWKLCGTHEFTQGMLVKHLCEEYDVSEDKASADVASMIEYWVNFNLVE